MRGFGLVQVMMVASAMTALTLGGAKVYNTYEESIDRDERSAITASQLKEFSEASYRLAASTQEESLSSEIIDINTLKNKGMISESFPDKTPYLQEIKGFIVDNNSTSSYDIVVTTTGNINEEVAKRSGVEGDIAVIQKKVYQDLRRQKLDIEGSYIAGLSEGNEFYTDGRIHVRDISRFNIGSQDIQPSVLLVSPNKTEAYEMKARAIHASPDSGIPSNNSAHSLITLSVRDQNGRPVSDEDISWNSTGGTLYDAQSKTDVNGLSTVKLRSNTHGTKSVTGRVVDNGANESVQITFTGPEIGSANASPSSNIDADGVMCSNFNVKTTYPDGTVASNEAITWSTTKGNFQNNITRTDSSGNTVNCLKSGVEGIANTKIKVNRTGDDVIKSVGFVGPRIRGESDMWVSRKTGIPANGSASSKVTVRVKYPSGKPARGVRINWTKTRGWLNSYSTTTNSNGETSVWIKSNDAGNARITATVPSGQSRSVTVGFDAARVVSIWANKTSNIPADNSSRATVYARVQYPDGTKAKNEIVYWGKSRGSLDHGATRTNNDGVATNRIRSGSAGTSRVTASYAGTSKAINVSFKNTSMVIEYEVLTTMGQCKGGCGIGEIGKFTGSKFTRAVCISGCKTSDLDIIQFSKGFVDIPNKKGDIKYKGKKLKLIEIIDYKTLCADYCNLGYHYNTGIVYIFHTRFRERVEVDN